MPTPEVTQIITWVAVPNGFTASGRARLSVYVAPRLTPGADGRLEPFDFRDWPAIVDPAKLRIEVTLAGTTRAAEIVSRPDSELWTALFHKDTFVRPYAPDHTLGVYGSYPAARMHDLVKAGYQETFDQSPAAVPSGGLPAAYAELLPLFEDGGPGLADFSAAGLIRNLFRRDGDASTHVRLDKLVDLARTEAEQDLAANVRPHPIVAQDDLAGALAQFEVFRRKPAGATATAVPVTDEDTRLDFHQQLANLGEYPQLQRLLGLVIDVEFDATGIPATPDALVHVTPTFPNQGEPRTPSTACFFAPGELFHARPGAAGTHLRRGLLDLRSEVDGAPVYRIVQLDVDGAAMQTIELLHRRARPPMTPDATGDGGSEQTLGALRTAGVSVVQDEHARALIGDMRSRLAASANGEEATLFAEDLVRGLRVDINDVAAGAWRSLHERVGTYLFTATGEKREIPDEGFVQPSLVQPPPAPGARSASTLDPAAANYVAESVFLWQGWSLSARRPAEVMPEPEPAADSAVMPLDVWFRPARRSLPKLRFGRQYEVRIRTVDLAGNGLSRQEADELLAAGDVRPVLPPDGEAFRFCRFEPVASPVLLPRAKPFGGDTADRVVLRSTLNMTAQEYAVEHPVLALSAERHVLPPAVSQQTAEMFGRFDTATAMTADEAGLELLRRGQVLLPQEAVHPEPSIVVPYLPDPLAAGVALRSLPGMPDGAIARAGAAGLDITSRLAPGVLADADSVVLVEFAPSPRWPDLAGFRLRLEEGSGIPAWDPVQRVLTVFLPKGEVRTCRISCLPQSEDSVDLMAVWQWADERLRQRVAEGSLAASDLAARRDRLRQLSELGLAWMLTPFRELTLVHAVPQPVRPPEWLDLSARRTARQTYASPVGQARVHGPSTGRVELMARWTELVDDPARSTKPEPVTSAAPVYANPVPLPLHRTPPAPAGAPEPVASFDPVTEVVTLASPDNAAPDLRVAAAAAAMLDSADRLVDAAPVDPESNLDDEARQLRDLSKKEIIAAPSIAVPGRWQRLGWIGRTIKLAANPLDPSDPVDLPPDYDSALAVLREAAQNLEVQANAAVNGYHRVPGRHEFGDTKHRMVDYQFVATSRFGEAFRPPRAPGTPGPQPTLEPVLTVTGDPFRVSVPSSAHPPMPRVRFIVPGFAWRRAEPGQELHSSRAGFLRVYLDRPWFASNDGELLGVVLRPESPVETAELLRVTTQWGRDPLWRTAATTAGPTAEDFAGGEVFENVQLNETGVSTPTTIVAYRPSFDDRGRCFADILLDPHDSYFPFVRFALARYQPNSVPGMEMSAVLQADFAQLAPHRALTVTPDGNDRVEISLSGITHETAVDPENAGRTGTWVRVSIRERIPGTLDEAGWQTIGDLVELNRTELTWHGAVTVPASRTPGAIQLLIEELETYKSVDEVTGAPDLRDRVVFAETYTFA